MSEFWAAYKDPRWQKRRLEIMERDEFSCVNCGDTKKTLQVHHKLYRKDQKPWEYEDDALETLCQTCHDKATIDTRELKEVMISLDSSAIRVVVGYAKGLVAIKNGFDYVFPSVEISSYEEAQGFAAALLSNDRWTDKVIEVLDNGVLSGQIISTVMAKRYPHHQFDDFSKSKS